MNIMLVNVAERTHEIGVRKAIGARPADIRFQFLLEAVFISLGGAVLGVVAAVGEPSGRWPSPPMRRTFVCRGWACLCALVVATGVGVLFGYRPASEASKLNPVEALHT